MSAPRIIRARNVVYMDGKRRVDLFKGDELPANAPAELIKRLDVTGGLEPLGESTPAPQEPITGDYGSHKADELQAEADRRGLSIEGTGAGGNVLKDDLVKALEADDAQT